jgi:nucleotide-binding universal stress UspA family protein
MLNHILVPLDGSLLAECVLSHAVTLAQVFDARLTLLRVVERDQSTGLKRAIDPLQWQIRKVEAGAYLDSVVARFSRVGLQAEKVILEGLPQERIVEFTRGRGIGMIMISSHGQSGLSGWNVSSVVQKVILHAHVPMMIVRAHASLATDIAQMSYQRVLVPLDGSRRAECALPLAKKLELPQFPTPPGARGSATRDTSVHAFFGGGATTGRQAHGAEPDKGGRVPEATARSTLAGRRNTRHRR